MTAPLLMDQVPQKSQWRTNTYSLWKRAMVTKEPKCLFQILHWDPLKMVTEVTKQSLRCGNTEDA